MTNEIFIKEIFITFKGFFHVYERSSIFVKKIFLNSYYLRTIELIKETEQKGISK